MFSSTSSQDYSQKALEQGGNRPPFRRLRGYAFDPSMSLKLDTASINQRIFNIPWESELQPGPRGEYVEVVDFDPASGCWYEPVDLNGPNLLAQDGHPPSEGNPQFHQQMVYAVAMNTICNFQKALGRQVQWSPREDANKHEQFVQTLRIYPHALRAANAYYSPQKKALLFGYFQGPTGMVFSCLSQDIVAHETTHALLDGMHRRYIDDNHPDTLAFHEAFADLVALFQHFTFPEVLKHQISRTRGNLEAQSLLSELAQEFGVATGRYGALRSAIGSVDDKGVWQPVQPDPTRLAQALEPHERGSILVAAMFSAFLEMYKLRSAGIVCLASAGTGKLPDGALHPVLVEELATVATKTAHHFLHMAIRALDYCPPFDITFGDYLRALVTADYDMVPDDRYGYRVALIESFRRWGILPEGLKTLSEEQLRWPYARIELADGSPDPTSVLASLASELSGLVQQSLYQRKRSKVYETLKSARAHAHKYLESMISSGNTAQCDEFMRVTGLELHANGNVEGLRYGDKGLPSFEVHLVQPTLRVMPDGDILKQLIISITQRRRKLPVDEKNPAMGSFDFPGGCTLVFDLEGDSRDDGGVIPTLRYTIKRPLIDDKRLAAVRSHRSMRYDTGVALRSTYFRADGENAEPFCMLHSTD
jgi:hypothetical protein